MDLTVPDLTPCADRGPVVQGKVARGTVLQMDQAAPAGQGLSRPLRERGQDPDLDWDRGLRAGGDCEEAAASGGQSLHDPSSMRITLFEKTPIKEALAGAVDSDFDSINNTPGPKQLELFDF